MTLSVATNPTLSRLCIPQSSGITRASPSDCFAEMQSLYSIAPADWASCLRWWSSSFLLKHITKRSLSRLFLPLDVPQEQHLAEQLSHHWFTETSHHWEHFSDHSRGMCTGYFQLCKPYSTASLIERRTSAAYILRLFLVFLVYVWGQMVTYTKMISFFHSINVIFITPSFVLFDLCQIILFK